MSMRIDVAPHRGALARRNLTKWRTVVIDAVRASSTIVQALASGADRVIPVATLEEAMACKRTLESAGGAKGPSPLLGGERRGRRPPRFDLGNSPGEYTADVVGGRTIVLTTTNGTRALQASRDAGETLVGAFLNLPALADYLARQGGDVMLAPVGRQGRPVLDDIVCAGMYVDRLLELAPDCQVTPGAWMACFAYRGYRGRIVDALRQSPSGEALTRIGFEADLVYCAQVGICDVVPRLANGEIRRAQS